MPSRDSIELLRQRMAAATPADTMLGMFLESSLLHVREKRGPELAERLRKEVLGERKAIGFYRYGVTDVLRMVEQSFPEDSPPEAFASWVEGFARMAVKRFFDSPVGQALMVLSASRVHNLLAAAPLAYKAVLSFGERRYEMTGERSAAVWFQGDLLGAAWGTGVLKQGVETTCSLPIHIDADLLDPRGTHFILRISW